MRYSEISEAARSKLPLSKGALRNARDRHGALIAVMAPMDFLRLTCHDSAEIDAISGAPFASVDNYDKGQEYGPHGELFHKSQYNMPFLNVLYPSGQVTGHEGRHRAAMIVKAGGTSFPVVLYFRNELQFVMRYTQTNYGTEPEESVEKTEIFPTADAMRARRKELLDLGANLDQPFSYGHFHTDTAGGNELRGNPERQNKQDRRSYAAWLPSDIPLNLIGQFDQSIHIPTARMRIGSLKRQR